MQQHYAEHSFQVERQNGGRRRGGWKACSALARVSISRLVSSREGLLRGVIRRWNLRKSAQVPRVSRERPQLTSHPVQRTEQKCIGCELGSPRCSGLPTQCQSPLERGASAVGPLNGGLRRLRPAYSWRTSSGGCGGGGDLPGSRGARLGRSSGGRRCAATAPTAPTSP